MNETKHPLLEKQLTKPPRNWKEWLEHWNATSNPLTLLSLLHYGPEMPDIDASECYTEAITLYLRLARQFYNKEIFQEKTGLNGESTIFTFPRYTLAKAAFHVLCKCAFKKTNSNEAPWKSFAYDQVLIDELIIFLDADNLEVNCGEDGLHCLFCYTQERYQEILKTFCLGFATLLITMPFPPHTSDTEKAGWTNLWRPRRKAAIKILWYLDELDLLITHKQNVDESILVPLQELILHKEIYVPISSRSSKEISKKPKDVRDLLKIVPNGFFWNHGYDAKKRVKATYLYLGLTSKPD